MAEILESGINIQEIAQINNFEQEIEHSGEIDLDRKMECGFGYGMEIPFSSLASDGRVIFHIIQNPNH